ncbi:MAG: acetate--CoA ligase [Ignavibacteria bacterium]|jgi:acetyl-CoA synthetase
MEEQHISSVLTEERTFAPSKEFVSKAHISGKRALSTLVQKADQDIVAFWEERAMELAWFRPWKKALAWKHPHAQWFVGGTTNLSMNCLDRHLGTSHRNKAAIIWESEQGRQRTYTYFQLHREVCKTANMLRNLGVQKDDVVAIYMGMVPEAAIAMLACARIGAAHNVIFGGFSSEALRERINDSHAKVLITQDGTMRRGEVVQLKQAADVAVQKCKTIKHVVVLRHTNEDVPMKARRDVWWHEQMSCASAECEPAALPSEQPLFILYTSGSTGKPKGILHTTGGYMTQVAYTTKVVFDLRDDDVYFCTADIGWITGHSYVVYGPLLNGATIMMYEGAPNYPQPDRFWDIIERNGVTVFYTAPTAIRSFMKWGDAWPNKHDLSSLRLLGSVGEPINPEAWMWYHNVIGGQKCPIVDTWWQTETGSIMIAPLPGASTTTPGTVTRPLPGIKVDVVRKDGTACKANEGGLLVVQHPWPSMLRTVYGDDERYQRTYWSEFPKSRKHPGWYFTGDGARKDKRGNIWIIGRVDDVVNVSGHRLGTAEIESALVSHPLVAEAAVVARPDEIKGNALVAFVTLKSSPKKQDQAKLVKQLQDHVAKEIGPIAKPDDIHFADALPKTRSGKIMRRLLREIVTGAASTGDTTTLEDVAVLERLR